MNVELRYPNRTVTLTDAVCDREARVWIGSDRSTGAQVRVPLDGLRRERLTLTPHRRGGRGRGPDARRHG